MSDKQQNKFQTFPGRKMGINFYAKASGGNRFSLFKNKEVKRAFVNFLFLILSNVDADECSLETHDCSADAYCNDTVGSFKCTCRIGFTGDGRKCRSKIPIVVPIFGHAT